MSNLFETLLYMSFSGSMIALLIFIIKPLIRRRISKTWQYYIWLLVIFRLLCPFRYDIPITIPFHNLKDETKEATNIPAGTAQKEAADSKEKIQFSSETKSFHFMVFVEIIWLLTASFLLLKNFFRYFYFCHRIKSESHLPEEETLYLLYHNLCQTLKIRRIPPLFIHSQVPAPMLIGIFRPVLLLPNCDIPSVSIRLILRHELIHFKRFDSLYKWTIQILCCIHWFNPIFYFVRKEINKSCELSCDEWVTYKMNQEEKTAYGDTILSFIRPKGSTSPIDSFSLSLNEDMKLIQERLVTIMRQSKKSKLIYSLTFLLTFILFCSTVLTGGRFINAFSPTESKDPIEILDPENVTVSETGNTNPTALSGFSKKQTVTFNSVDLYHYSDNSPYLCDSISNNTNKKITGYEMAMLAFDSDGNPLKLQWHWNSKNRTYKYVYNETDDSIKANTKSPKDGGWSLLEEDKEVPKIEYAIFCFKSITFQGGKVWKNPEYKNWLKTYEGKKVPVKKLENYYPYQQVITF